MHGLTVVLPFNVSLLFALFLFSWEVFMDTKVIRGAQHALPARSGVTIQWIKPL